MADDVGFRIAPAKKSVLKISDSEVFFTSKRSVPKSSKYKEINLENTGNPTSLNHDLNDIPFVLAYGTADGSNKVLGYYDNIYDITGVRVRVSADFLSVRAQVLGAPPNKKVFIYSFAPEI